MPVIDGYMLIRKIRSLPIEQGGKIPSGTDGERNRDFINTCSLADGLL
ncbi:hypothetical protein PL9214500467 [Planktothrix tepida PCC 9214]|uniref:Uncharacterized protein n=1 Tax=Planktothrix tepida PCC 9214 TaxID=671072 RepID=A0A1J1LMQ6_9CYAN|nr:hypothetical protein PL9214500467 [Planktothrix tepida PCC 9214]